MVARSFHAGCAAVGIGGGVGGDIGVAVCEAAAVGDVAEVLASVGGIVAVEGDGLGLGGGADGEEEDGKEKGCIREHGGFFRMTSPLVFFVCMGDDSSRRWFLLTIIK